MVVFGIALTVGVIYTGISIAGDLGTIHSTSIAPFVLLGVALLTALGFEFVNGFHDTANAVATVIYTHSLEPHVAVVWSGFCNFAGVLVSSGAVAFGIISLLPVELILQVSSGAGFAMVFALLIAAILWNLGTWYLGLPASSSHTMVLDQRRRLGSGKENRREPADLSADRFLHGCPDPPSRQGCYQRQAAV